MKSQGKMKRSPRDKSYLGPNFIAPDGGWGWLVCFAAGFSHISIFSMQFGLVYKDHLIDLGLSHSQITAIPNVTGALSFIFGALNGPIFRRFTCRQVGVFSALMSFAGLFFMALSQTFLEYLLSYGILFGTGVGLFFSSVAVSLNTYFVRKRRLANGICWTIASLGTFAMPYITSLLLASYGVQGTVLICAALSTNAIAGALTFQPVQWHSRKKDSHSSIPIQVNDEKDQIEMKQGHHNSCDEADERFISQLPGQEAASTTVAMKMKQFFDLDLFQDTNYTITAVGLTITDFAEMNFNVLTPIILGDAAFSNDQIVTLLTIIAGVDCAMRLIIPMIVEKLDWKNRNCYLGGVLILAGCRIVLAHVSDYTVICYFAVVMGIGKAVIAVFLTLVMPSCVPLERLPEGTGLQFAISGVFTIIMGPVVGIIRDNSDFRTMLHCLNILAYTTTVLWCTQSVCWRLRRT